MIVCKLKGHKLDGPENDGQVLCSRCGDVFNADFLREIDKVLVAQGKKPILPPRASTRPKS